MAHASRSESFLKTAAEYLDLEDPAHSHREDARRILIEEFIDALADGPETLVSCPPANGVEQVPVVKVVRAMFYASEALATALCAELASEMPDVPRLLASHYADAWLAYLDAAEAIAAHAVKEPRQ